MFSKRVFGIIEIYILVCGTPNCVVAEESILSGFGATSGAGSGNNKPSFEPNDGIIVVEIFKPKPSGPEFVVLLSSFDFLPIGGKS